MSQNLGRIWRLLIGKISKNHERLVVTGVWEK
jgi:hypothetical protein